MNINKITGVIGHQTKIVEKKDTASQFESGLANVYATPAMIALMEKTAFKSIEHLLPDGYSTVGIFIKVQHLKASLPGAIITCKSEVIKTDGKKIFFEISAFDEKGIIGKSDHTRYLINSEEFIKSLHPDK